MTSRSRRPRPAALVLCALAASAVFSGHAAAQSVTPPAVAPAPTAPATAADGRVDCTVTDAKLAQLSGLSARRGTLYAVSDQTATVYELDDQCRVTKQTDLRQSVEDLEDLGQSVDGLLWLADIGGNRAPRSAVAVLRYNPESGRLERYALDYPDGPHDAEALLVTPNAQVYVVTKDESGISGVYTAPSPLDPAASNRLQRVAELDLRGIEGRSRGNGSTLVTGGAVSYDGTRFVLRTYLDAFEWQAPDGDVAEAVTTRGPNVIPLPLARQGEAVTYDEGGVRLLLGGEQLPSQIHSVPLAREAAAPAPAASRGDGGTVPRAALVAVGAVALLLVLGLLLLVLVQRSRRPGHEHVVPGT